jgi:hypothetical protein
MEVLMKSIVLVALLAAGCSSKPKEPEGPDCAGSIGKGVEAMSQKIKARATQMTPQTAELMQGMMTKVQTTLTTRCTEDKWPAETLPCFAATSTQPEISKCLDKLPPDQQAKARAALVEVMRGSRPRANHAAMMGGSSAPPAMGSDSTAPPAASSPAPAPAGSAAGSGSAAGW